MKAIILAGGKGTRLAPYTKILPKPLMPIGDMPILEVIIRQLKCAGVTEVTLAVGHLSELFRAFFNNGEKLDLKINYSYEETPLGTAGPLALIGGLEDTFLVANGDVLTTLDVGDLIRFHKENKAAATIAVHARQVNIDFGVIEWNKSPWISDYIEKPTYDFMVSMGLYIFEPAVLNYIPKDQYFDFPDLILKLLESGEKVAGYRYDGYWQDLGRPDDYESAAQDFEEMRSQFLGEECDR